MGGAGGFSGSVVWADCYTKFYILYKFENGFWSKYLNMSFLLLSYLRLLKNV